MTDDGVDRATIIIDRALVFLRRPEVIEQLIVLGVVLLLSRIVSRLLWWMIDWWRIRLSPS